MAAPAPSQSVLAQRYLEGRASSGSLGDAAAVLAAMADASVPGAVLAGAVSTMGTETWKEAAPACVKLLEDGKGDAKVRVGAAEALAAAFEVEGSNLAAVASFAFPTLLDACTDKNNDVKEAARKAAEAAVPALGAAGISLNMGRLLKACNEQKWDVVDAAFRAEPVAEDAVLLDREDVRTDVDGLLRVVDVVDLHEVTPTHPAPPRAARHRQVDVIGEHLARDALVEQ